VGADVRRLAVGQRSDLTATKPRAGQIDDTGAFDVTVDPSGVPDFFVKRATKLVLDAATKGLCDWVSNRVPVRERED